MTSKIKHSAAAKRTDPAVAVSVSPRGFRLPDPHKRRASGIRGRQTSSIVNRKVPVTLPTLSCDKD